MSDPIVGIDLGTSNSVVAHADEASVVRILADEGGFKIHPSVVSFHPNGGIVIGAGAKQRKVIDPQNTIYSVKRLIGRGYHSPEVQIAKTRVPYQIKEGANQLPIITTRGGEFAVPEISAIVLDHMRNIAAEQLGTPVSRAVVTVPASFNDAQRSATATAGAIAGLTIVRVLNEPTAAALAYGNTRNLRETIAVYDFGGGTFDITILKLHDHVYEVLGTSGDTFLGGDDLDERLVDKMVAKFLEENRIDLRTNEVAMMRLRAVAEQTKIELSRRSRAVVRVDEIAYGARGAPLNLMIEISRDEFVSQVADIIDRTFPVCQEALHLAGLGIDEISDIILVGGTTKIPYVRDQVSRFFEKAARTDVSPEDAVAAGAALQARSLERTLSRQRAASRQVPLVQPPPEVIPPVAAAERQLDSYTDVDFGADTGSVTIVATEDFTIDEPRRASAMPDLEATNTDITRSPEIRPDTAYSVTRGGQRDAVLDKTFAPNPLLAATQPGVTGPLQARRHPSAVPLAAVRLTRTPPQPQPRPKQTMFGVPPGPAAVPAVGVPTAHVPPAAPRATQTSRGQPAQTRSPEPPRPNRATGSAVAGAPTQPLIPAAGATAQPLGASGPEFQTETVTAQGGPAASMTVSGMGGSALAAHQHPTHADDFREALVALPIAATFHAPQSYPISVPELAPPPSQSPLLLEVTPRGLGIGTVAGFCEELIRRNSRVPTQIKKLFTTSRDRQATVRIVVCQGESRRLDRNTVIGDLVLHGLSPKPRGETSIEVTFMLDAAGVLQVKARDSLTGTEQSASLDLVGGVPLQDVAASRLRIQQLRR